MLRVRPVALTDLDALEQLAGEAGLGMTNLPADRTILEARIRTSIDSFAAEITTPGEEAYLLVLEDTANGRIVGTGGVFAAVGLSRPFYSYQISQQAHTSRELNRYDSVTVLQMVNEYRGASELGMLFLTPDYRRDRNGRFLSRFRFLFLAEFAERFGRPVMAEMRGVSDAQGRSPFWDNLGRHFFDMDFTKADILSSQGNYQFIADLMPKHPIYIRLLPKVAQQVIGVPHEATRPALKLLEREGFRFEGYVDIFDAGPTVHCPLDQIRTVRDSQRAPLIDIVDKIDGEDYMIATTRLNRFRACRGAIRLTEAGLTLGREVVEALEIEPGDMLRLAAF